MNNAYSKIFKDKHGRVVLIQPANVPLIVGIAGTVLRSLVKNGTIFAVANWASLIGFTVWAVWELAAGVTLFRRGLGLVVLVILALSRFRH